MNTQWAASFVTLVSQSINSESSYSPRPANKRLERTAEKRGRSTARRYAYVSGPAAKPTGAVGGHRMGALQCERHGTHPGRLCCDHVREAVSNSTQNISFDKYQVDLMEDGSMALGHILCV